MLKALGVHDRKVHLVDSFEGLPTATQTGRVRVRITLANLGPDLTCVRDPRRPLNEVASLTLVKGIDSWVNVLRERHGLSAHHKLLLTGAWKAVQASDIVAAGFVASVSTLADVAGDGSPHRLLTPVLASTPSNPLLDPAWSEIVVRQTKTSLPQVLVCDRHAAATVDAEPRFRRHSHWTKLSTPP